MSRIVSFLFVGDVHLRDGDPQSRTPGYCDQILEKLVECGEHARTYDVDFVAFSGDIFHHKEPNRTSHKLVRRAMGILQDYPCERFACVGNHDLTADRIETLERQPLGNLIQSKAITKVEELVYGPVWLGFSHYHVDYEELPSYSPFGAASGLGISYRVLFTHGALLPESYYFLGQSIRYPQVLQLGIDLYCNGHIHDDLGVKKVRGSDVIFAAPGSLSRGAVHEYNLTRQVSVLLVRIEREDERVVSKFKLIPIAAARPATEIFSLEEIKRKKSKQEEIEAFVRRLSEEASSEVVETSLTDALTAYCGEMEITPEVTNCAMGYLERSLVKEDR